MSCPQVIAKATQFIAMVIKLLVLSQQDQISFSHKELDVTQSLHGNVFKVVNNEGQVTDVCHAL